MPSDQSKPIDLASVTEAAHRLLRITRVLQSHLPACRPTDDPRLLKILPKHQSARLLPVLLEAHLASVGLGRVFSDAAKWTFAGLANSSGISVGKGTWSSAHEAVADLARVARDYLRQILIGDEFVERVTRDFDWPDNIRMLTEFEKELKTHWRSRGRSETYRTLLWCLSLAVSPIEAARLATLVDCEHAHARRIPATQSMRLPKSTMGSTSRSAVAPIAAASKTRAMQFLRALKELRADGKPGPQKKAVYAKAKLAGGSRTRAFDFAVALRYVDADLTILAEGSRALSEGV